MRDSLRVARPRPKTRLDELLVVLLVSPLLPPRALLLVGEELDPPRGRPDADSDEVEQAKSRLARLGDGVDEVDGQSGERDPDGLAGPCPSEGQRVLLDLVESGVLLVLTLSDSLDRGTDAKSLVAG